MKTNMKIRLDKKYARKSCHICGNMAFANSQTLLIHPKKTRLDVVVLCLFEIALHLILLRNVLVSVIQEFLCRVSWSVKRS